MGLAPGLPIMQARIQLPSDDETLSLFQPPDPISAKIDEYIKNHPVALLLRQNPDFTESRPHLKLHETIRSHNFTGGTLAGPDKIVVPPLTFSEKGGKTLTAICYLGRDLCGHPNIIHGGLLATMLDEAMARCCFPALPHKLGMTANLTMNYRAPLPANSYVCIRATTTKVEGRKAWVEAWIESLPAGDEQPTLFVEATSLFIEPKHARVCQCSSSIWHAPLTSYSRHWLICTRRLQLNGSGSEWPQSYHRNVVPSTRKTYWYRYRKINPDHIKTLCGKFNLGIDLALECLFSSIAVLAIAEL